MVRRIAVALIGIPVALGIIWYGSWPLAVLVALIGVLGTRELYNLASQLRIEAFRASGAIAAGLLPILAYAALAQVPIGDTWLASWRELSTIWVLALLLWLASAARMHPLAAVGGTVSCGVSGVLPHSFSTSSSIWPAQSWPGAALVFFPLIVTWVCDTAAMLGGRMIGGAKLAPAISPGKTRAGAIAGVVAGTLVAPVFAIFVFPPLGIAFGMVPAVLTAALLAVVGQCGDLVESLFKREAGVKDSSALIPGHGALSIFVPDFVTRRRDLLSMLG